MAKLSEFFYENRQNDKIEDSEFKIKLMGGNKLTHIRGEINPINNNNIKYGFICSGNNFEPNGGVLDTISNIIEENREKRNMEKINEEMEYWYDNRQDLLSNLVIKLKDVLENEGKEKLVEYIDNSGYEIFPV